ncbi:hypothetical protein MB02_14035 [Croceicoccus estronivorus]|uniref:hypothetical protein n=1 Tax=Croceicoccus estronivorus TaxID=1172626 RepID=UPI000832690D|nr:hypothetical protein [Croceicoccus estronivorus]OCC22888.1 hypothetical protein MB02_14035 [Croceicoccus estronivorus]
MGSSSKPRLVLYGIGQFGKHVVRFAHQKGWPIVAAFNRAGAKVGQDVGELAGIGKIGVIVQDCDTADYSRIDADIGVVTSTNLLETNHDAHTRLIGAGLNVICHGTESYFPQANNPELAARLDAMAKEMGVTFTGSGIWDMSRIWSGLLVSGPTTELKSLLHRSCTDIVPQCESKEQTYPFGNTLSIEEWNARGIRDNPIAASYSSIALHVVTALGYTVRNCTTYTEPCVFEEDYPNDFMECTIPAGNCVGIRMVAEIETEEGLTARSEIEVRHFREGDVEHMFWEVEGMPGARIRVERDDSSHMSAACLFNRIPDVIAAPPGVQPVSKMGPLKSTALNF